MSSLAGRASPGPLAHRRRRARTVAFPLPGADTALALALGVVLAAVAFAAAGGLRLERTTYVEVALMLGGAGLCATALLSVPRGTSLGNLYGGWTLLAMAGLAALTAASIAWSLAPADSWVEANRTFAYLATFAGGIALVRLMPRAWNGMLEGVALGCLLVCVYALATKVFPGALAADEVYARLREPLGYWNAVGLMAALGVPPLLWLAARRSGHGAANALAWPGLGLLLVCLMLSYSRGALLALAIGLAFWFAAVPLRLRGAVALLAAIAGAAPVVAWAFSMDALTSDRLPAEIRAAAGHELGALLVLMSVVLLVAGLALNFAVIERPPSERTRRALSRMLLAALAVLPLVAVVLIATAPGGISGQASKTWDQLTNPDARTPANTPDRLTAASSVRARYWDEALKVWRTSELAGTGAGAYATVRTRFRKDPLEVRHAHGYGVQTLADLGLAGVAVSLAALLAWLLAAARATGLRPRDRGLPFDAERVGLLSLATVVVVFGVHSFVDWTWFVPANAVVGLLCAGWVAGRGPLGRPEPPPEADAAEASPAVVQAVPPPVPVAGPLTRWRARVSDRIDAPRATAATLVMLVALVGSWAAAQPVRAVHAGDAAIDRLEAGALDASANIARIGTERNPLAVEPLWELGAIENARGRGDSAEQALEAAVRLQPANAETWRRLGEYRLNVLGKPQEALSDFKAALYLDPRAPESQADALAAARAVREQQTSAAPAP